MLRFFQKKLTVEHFDALNAEMKVYSTQLRRQIDAMERGYKRDAYIALIDRNFFLIGRLKRFAEDRHSMSELARQLLKEIPKKLIVAYEQFENEYLDQGGLLDEELPFSFALARNCHESRQAGIDWDQRLSQSTGDQPS